MENLKPIFLSLIFFGIADVLPGQSPFDKSPFDNAKILVDTLEFSWKENQVLEQNKKHLSFAYTEENQVAEVYLHYAEGGDIDQIEIIPSADYYPVDSLIMNENHAKFKVRFNQLTNAHFLKFLIRVSKDTISELVELPLFPFTETYIELYPPSDQLYIGEEKVFELTTNNPENIVADNRWSKDFPINYRVVREGAKILLHLLPNALGDQTIGIPFQFKKPYLKDSLPNYWSPPLEHSFTIRSGRLAFIQFDKNEVTPHDDKIKPIEVQIDNHRLLKLGKTYRIENQEEPGGALIAELYTKARLNNDKVMCLLRPYAFHRKEEGYLYIKDGDAARFVANVDITPKTSIRSIYVQREGKDWQKSNVVRPGETINIRLEGQGLHKANFSFPDAKNLDYDSLVKNERISIFSLKVPLNISTNKIEIFNHDQATGKYLIVKEYERPRPFDFIALDFGDQQIVLGDIDKPIYYENTLTDLFFDFERNKIDQGNNLYGRQYLKIKVKISNKKGNLIELYQFDDLVVCPGEASPRYLHYNGKNCKEEGINLNNFITKKTSELEEWSRIELEIAHDKAKYGGQGKSKKVRIYLKRDYNYDIDVSFPTGLLILKPNASFGNFGGPSFAMMAQVSFYEKGKIAKYRPFKIGAGFIAIDAFNFAESNNRDVGLVVIGSLYPTANSSKLTFPLYVGGGYLLRESVPFFLIGPGIRVRF